MWKERKDIALGAIQLNTGQIDWLPANPRTWTQSDIDDMRDSILEDQDFLEDRPLLVVPFGKAFVVFGGNLRHVGAVAAKLSKAPCVVYHNPETDADYETILRRAMKDNGQFGKTNWDAIYSSKWGTLPLEKWGLTPKGWTEPEGGEAASDMGLSTKDKEGDEEYNEFVEKFEQKLTTDDCYTPPAVYDAVQNFVKTITPLNGRKVIRPFFPGGDYEDLSQYQKGCIVIDNPPFSILSKICRFYCKHGIQFFLFAPSLTLFTATDCDLTYIVSDSDIIYENGAKVRTGFITNIESDLRIWLCPELARAIEDAQETEDKTKQGFVYPDNIITAAILQKIVARDIELRIRKKSCEYINSSDSAKEQGRDLYGGGFIMSDNAAAERAAAERAAAERAAAERAAAERAAAERAAAERAAATRLNISAREKAIIEKLNEQDKEYYGHQPAETPGASSAGRTPNV